MTNDMTLEEKYAQPEVVDFWRNLSQTGLQKCEQIMVERYLPQQGHLLDVGCGSGRAVFALEQAGYQVTGTDLSLHMLAAGRSLAAQAKLNGANLLALPFANNSFEAAIMFFGVLQHIPGRSNRLQALAELARVTKLNGRLILALDNIAPALSCYSYWLLQKLRHTGQDSGSHHSQSQAMSQADSTLWNRQSRQVNPLVWHIRGLLRSLRWRTWPGLVDLSRKLKPNGLGAEPGDVRVAQFAIPPTPGHIYYHLYRPEELIEDAAEAGWHLLGHHSGSELNERRKYPVFIRDLDKQQLFAFEKSRS